MKDTVNKQRKHILVADIHAFACSFQIIERWSWKSIFPKQK